MNAGDLTWQMFIIVILVVLLLCMMLPVMAMLKRANDYRRYAFHLNDDDSTAWIDDCSTAIAFDDERFQWGLSGYEYFYGHGGDVFMTRYGSLIGETMRRVPPEEVKAQVVLI